MHNLTALAALCTLFISTRSSEFVRTSYTLKLVLSPPLLCSAQVQFQLPQHRYRGPKLPKQPVSKKATLFQCSTGSGQWPLSQECSEWAA